jgi:DNA-binding IclR family transcriptional regulator
MGNLHADTFFRPGKCRAVSKWSDDFVFYSPRKILNRGTIRFTMNAWSEPKTQSVPALERGLMILEYLAQSRRGVTLSQLTRKLQLPRSTGHALLLTYQRTGYVHRCEKTGRYCLGLRLQALANQAIGGTSLRTQAAPLLHQLMQETGLTIHLAVMEEGEAILIDRIEAPGSPHLATWVGKRMGLHCTAVGKVLISELPENVLDDLIRKHGMMRYNENTIASRRTLRIACESVQRLGYAVDDEEEEIGVRCIGAPVRNGAGDIVAAISLSGTKAQLESFAARASQVVTTAALLSQEITGFSRGQQQPFRGLSHAFQLES